MAIDPNLRPEDFDWLRQIRTAPDTKRRQSPVPMSIAGKLRAFGFTEANNLGSFTITDPGRLPSSGSASILIKRYRIEVVSAVTVNDEQ